MCTRASSNQTVLIATLVRAWRVNGVDRNRLAHTQFAPSNHADDNDDYADADDDPFIIIPVRHNVGRLIR